MASATRPCSSMIWLLQRYFPSEPAGKPKNPGVGSLSLLKGSFLIQESSLHQHCRQTLYCLIHQESPTLPLIMLISNINSPLCGSDGSNPKSVIIHMDSFPQHKGIPKTFWCNYYCSVAQSCPTLCDPMDCSTPGFPDLLMQ